MKPAPHLKSNGFIININNDLRQHKEAIRAGIVSNLFNNNWETDEFEE